LRYYDIKIWANGAASTAPPLAAWASHYGNLVNPGALDIEVDLGNRAFAEPDSNSSFVRLWGIGLDQISQAQDYNPSLDGTKPGKTIRVELGMKPGLPLATAQSKGAGLVIVGTIQQGFGNWVGLDQTLDLLVYPLVIKSPAITFSWPAGTKLADAIRQTINRTFPAFTIAKLAVSDRLVRPDTQVGMYPSLGALAAYLQGISRETVNDLAGYQGVNIVLRQGQFYITDGTADSTPIPILYTDLIGQVTWLSLYSISFTTVMRADIQVNDRIKLPPGPSILTSGVGPPAVVDAAVFSGTWFVTRVRHVGRFRDPQGSAWCTVFEASSTRATPSTTAPSAVAPTATNPTPAPSAPAGDAPTVAGPTTTLVNAAYDFAPPVGGSGA
jgi:hypothetical protein